MIGLVAVSSAQSMEWSNSRKLKGSAVFTSVIGENSDGIYLLRYRNKFLSRSIIIERYRHQMGLALSRSIVLKKSRLLHVELQKDRIILILSRFNRKEMRNQVVYQVYDNDVEPIGEEQIILESTLNDFYDKGDFRIRISNDRKRFLITHTEQSADGNRVLVSALLDDSLKLVHSKRWELDVKYDAFALHDILVDNSGNAYYLVNDHELTSRRNSEVPLDWRLFWYNPASDSMHDFEIIDSGFVLMGPHMSWDRGQNKINITAFYSGVEEVHDIIGLFNFYIKPIGIGAAKAQYHEFSADFKSVLTGENPTVGLEGVRNFKILDVLPNSNGGLSIVAERSSFTFESDVIYVNGIPQSTSRNIYNYEDVLVMALEPDLRIRWYHLINKSQSSLNDGGYYSSIITANTRSRIYVIYNDRLRTNGDVIQYTFTSDGEMNHKILIRSSEEYISVIPREARQIGYNKVILPVSKDKKFALLKLEYPK
ncbi:MAG: hypothetical protein H6608_07865 [Flavobacteriales bacterium]|nr:hypothetical protein [Bacteroidota bacterium]MCB9241032.1 hypothetical protein [Flavobacteriales bacterium]